MAIKMKNLMKLVTQGQTGHSVYVGYAAFVTTGGTVTVPLPMKVVKSVNLTIAGTPASDEEVSVTNTVNAAGEIRSTTLITLTVSRTGASKTSGLGFWFLIVGEQ